MGKIIILLCLLAFQPGQLIEHKSNCIVWSADGNGGKCGKKSVKGILRLRSMIGGAGIYMRVLDRFSKIIRSIKGVNGIRKKERLQKKGGLFIKEKIL